MADLKRVRSPNYPAISLPEAIAAANKLSSKIGRHSAAKEAIAKTLGYGGLNGASTGAISALVKYGVLEKSGEDLKLSERAMKLIAAQSIEEHTAALWEAARAPALFAELVEQYKGSLPDDEVIRSYLKRKGFADSALPQVIQSFRETMEFVTLETGAYDGSRKSEAENMQASQQTQDSSGGNPPTKAAMQTVFQMRLNDGTVVRLDASGELDSKHAKVIKGLVDMALGADPGPQKQ